MTNRIDMNPGFDPGSSSRRDPNSISMHPRKHRKQVKPLKESNKAEKHYFELDLHLNVYLDVEG